MPIQNKLRDLRFEFKMDQNDFANFLGANGKLYNRWENQNGQPSLEWAFKISIKTGKRIEEFMYYEPDED